MKALLMLRLTVDHDDNSKSGYPAVPVYQHIRLYREDDGLIWRSESEIGDQVQVLPRPATLEQAKVDARKVYPKNSTWQPKASWI